MGGSAGGLLDKAPRRALSTGVAAPGLAIGINVADVCANEQDPAGAPAHGLRAYAGRRPSAYRLPFGDAIPRPQRRSEDAQQNRRDQLTGTLQGPRTRDRSRCSRAMLVLQSLEFHTDARTDKA
jgi:hypothetical protein